MPFINKDLSKAIMTRTKLRNIFLQNKCEENKIRYTKQRNFCVSLLRKTKKRYYENLNEKSVVDNKLFWKTVKTLFGVPQGSILGPLLFNVFLIDLFFIIENTDIASHADDNTPYISAGDIDGVIKSLEEALATLFKWFSDNLKKSNADKCHLLISLI